MIFHKSASSISRSTFASAKSKNLWGTSASGQSQAGPGFFVSTPQFTRHQQSQLAPYFDGRGAGNSGSSADSGGGIGNPYLALSGGANCGAAPHQLFHEDETKEEVASRPSSSPRRAPARLALGSEYRPAAPKLAYRAERRDKDEFDSGIDFGETVLSTDDMLLRMRRLQDIGSHNAVLATFETLESMQDNLPIDAYNMVLRSLASSGDVVILLEAYEKMLARGIKPNMTTYSIVVNELLEGADTLLSRRAKLISVLGADRELLESVDEIYEGLAVEEHLTLAVNILQAVLASHEGTLDAHLQSSLDRAVAACIRAKIDVPDTILDTTSPSVVELIAAQPTIALAAEKFTSLPEDIQRSEAAQSLMLNSYFRLQEPRGAIAFFSGCGTPAYLRQSLLTGFTSSGLVSTARMWADQINASTSEIGAAISAIPPSEAGEHLASATQLFYRLIDGGGGSGSGNGSASNDQDELSTGRNAYLRLCVAAGQLEPLYMAIRESRLHDATWDAVTLTEVVDLLSSSGQQMLAADVFAWQIPKLETELLNSELRSFVDQEIATDVVRMFQNRGQLCLEVAIRIFPVVILSTVARNLVLDVIAAARIGAPHELSELIDSDTVKTIVITLAHLATRNSLSTDDSQLLVLRLLTMFTEDAIALKSDFTNEERDIVEEALMLTKDPDALVALFLRKYPTDMKRRAKVIAEESLAIQRYALAPNGFDHAFSLFKNQLRRRQEVSPSAVGALIKACANNESLDQLHALFAIMPKTQVSLNALAMHAAPVDHTLAMRAREFLIQDLGVYPTAPVYSSLIRTSKNGAVAMRLFQEAKNDAPFVSTPQIYNATLIVLADSSEVAQAEALMTEMKELQFQPIVPAWDALIRMYVRDGQGEKAFAMLKSLNPMVKTLLEIKTFNHLMHFFVHVKAHRNMAIDVFAELRSTGTMATPYTYRLLMEAYLLAHQAQKPSLSSADKVLSLMRHDGAPITTQCFATLLRARGVLFKDFEGARDFYRGLIRNSRVLPDRSIFKALIESYITNGKQSEASIVLEEMKRYHIPVDSDIADIMPLTS